MFFIIMVIVDKIISLFTDDDNVNILHANLYFNMSDIVCNYHCKYNIILEQYGLQYNVVFIVLSE